MEQKKIRLSESQVAAICAAFRTCFNDGDSLWVFGSRADITKRGVILIFMLKQPCNH